MKVYVCWYDPREMDESINIVGAPYVWASLEGAKACIDEHLLANPIEHAPPWSYEPLAWNGEMAWQRGEHYSIDEVEVGGSV